MSRNILTLEKRTHTCDIGTQPNLMKSFRIMNKKPKMPKDAELFVYKNKSNNKYKNKSNTSRIKNARTHKGKNSKLKTKHQTKLSKSVFTKYHKIAKNHEAARKQHMRMFSQRAGKGFKVY